MISKQKLKKFCNGDISKIENYDKAIADKTQVWHCHHRRETIYSMKELIEIGEYYDRPPEELILLTISEHYKLHRGANNHNWYGKHLSEEHKNKMSIAKLGEKNFLWGKTRSDEVKRKISMTKRGKHTGEDNSSYGTFWWNDGKKSVRSKECPGDGWMKGRIRWKNKEDNK